MRLKLFAKFLFLFFLILLLDNVDGRERKIDHTKKESVIEQQNSIVDSIYIKFDPDAKFDLDILSKSNQIFVKPDTNYKAYFFDDFSSLFYFPIPTEIIYPICQGDSLIISSRNHLPYIKVINNRKYSEREVNFVTELTSKNINIFEYRFKRKGIPEDIYNATLNYTDTLLHQGELSGAYANWLKKQAEYSYLKLTQIKDIETVPVDNIAEKINIDSDLYLYYYQALLWKRMDRLLNEDYSSISHIIQVSDTNFTGESRDYVLYKFAIEHLSTINSEQAKSSISQLEGRFIDDGYLSLLKKRYLRAYNVDVDVVDQLLLSDGQTIAFEEMLSNYKGKKVYIDVWASWCAPCRAEIPYSRSLKKSLEGQNIAFVYLSIDKVQNDWLKANEEEGLGNVDSYLITNPLKSRFMVKYKINAIPRYFIIDETGNVINDDAPRPSSADIGAILKMGK